MIFYDKLLIFELRCCTSYLVDESNYFFFEIETMNRKIILDM